MLFSKVGVGEYILLECFNLLDCGNKKERPKALDIHFRNHFIQPVFTRQV
jgi:hypothetical protein